MGFVCKSSLDHPGSLFDPTWITFLIKLILTKMSKYDYSDPIYWRDVYNNASSAYKAGSAFGAKLKPYLDSAMSLPGEISRFANKYGLVNDYRRVNDMTDNSSSKRGWDSSVHQFKSIKNPFSKDYVAPKKRSRGNEVGVTESTEPPQSTNSIVPMRLKRFRTFGNYGGRFTGRVKKKAANAAFEGAILKTEYSSTTSDANAVYVGHSSAPLYQVLRAIGWSIARLVAKFWHQDFTHFFTTINGPAATSVCDLTVTYTYRTSIGGICIDQVSSTTGISYAALGDNLVNFLCATITSSTTYFELVRIRFSNTSAASTDNSLQTVVLYGDNLKILVSGYSKMKLQNNTVSTSGDAATNEQSTDIANNSLVGKQYFGFGHHHSMKYNDDYAVSVPAMYYHSNQGYLVYTPTTATSITDGMKNVLTKVPNHKAFNGLKGYRNIKLAPGEIQSSVVKWSKKATINQWIKMLMPAFQTASTMTTVRDGMDPLTNFGKTSIVGLEHMLHSGTEPDVNVSFQIDTTVTGIAKHKKKMFCSPGHNVSLGTLMTIT